MNSMECELIGLIRESDDLENAMVIAMGIITDFLRQHCKCGVGGGTS